MSAVALKEEDPEQSERAEDIGLKSRRLHFLNICEQNIKTYLLNVDEIKIHLLQHIALYVFFSDERKTQVSARNISAC